MAQQSKAYDSVTGDDNKQIRHHAENGAMTAT